MTDISALLIHERFDRMRHRTPSKTALRDARRSITYQDAGAWSDRLAADLIAAGVGPEEVVGVQLERSIESVIAMLAVLKAGAAYLSLPSAYPVDRLRHMLADARARVLINDGDTGMFPSLLQVLVGDPGPEPPAAVGRWPRARPDNLAYVFYTSGSTGSPKGVGVTHWSAANMVDPAQHYVRFAADETFLQLSPLAFDPSALEIWGALANGATLVIAAPSYEAIDDLPAVLADEGVSTLVLTPPLFHAIMNRRPAALDGIRQLIVGGDILSPASASAFTRRTGALLIDAYGPTEATTLVSAQPMDQIPADARRVPLGEALHGARIHLLDGQLRPVAPGGRGEIYLAGDVLARGYLHQPALTAQRFVPDPYAEHPGARMYASGDEGLRLASGCIEFIGRLDQQVKVRGHRVELGEVEQVLRCYPAVRDVCVLLQHAGGEKLVAHIAVDIPHSDELRAALSAHVFAALPPYMRPSRYQLHDSLPLTATGKVDRARLALTEAPPEPGADGRSICGMSQIEADLAALWCRHLEVGAVGLDDDFFALGGTSLVAIHIVDEAQERGIGLSLVKLFKNPTIRRLGGAVTATRDDEKGRLGPVSKSIRAIR